MKSSFQFLLLFTVHVLLIFSISNPYQCNQTLSFPGGFPDYVDLVKKCTAVYGSGIFAIPSAVNNFLNGPITVTAQMILYNLIAISDLTLTATVDVKFRLTWVDPRFDIPALFSMPLNDTSNETPQNFATLNTNYNAVNGIDLLSKIPKDSSGTQNLVNLWVPDIFFSNAININEINNAIRLRKGGELYWTRQFKMDLSQPSFGSNYGDYPADQQNINIRFESYGYPSTLLSIQWASTLPVSFQDENFQANPIWSSDKAYTIAIESVNKAITGKSRYFVSALVVVPILRNKNGLVLRLILPVLLVGLMTALLYWAKKDNRLSNTFNLLITVAALYITLTSSIPLVGYITKLDAFVFTIFVLVVLSIAFHVFQEIADVKADVKDIHSMKVLAWCIEQLGRITVLPTALGAFLLSFFQQNVGGGVPTFVVLSFFWFLNCSWNFRSHFSTIIENFVESVQLGMAKTYAKEQTDQATNGEIKFFCDDQIRVYRPSKEHIMKYFIQLFRLENTILDITNEFDTSKIGQCWPSVWDRWCFSYNKVVQE